MSEPIVNPAPSPEPAPVKTFTQEEVDAAISRRLARAMKGMPDEAELTAFREWKDNQKTDKERWDTLTQERDTARTQLNTANAEIEQYKREKLLRSKGISEDDVDYYAFKIGKLVTDEKTFEQAAEEFFKDNSVNKVRVDMTARLDGGKNPVSSSDTMNALIRGARK